MSTKELHYYILLRLGFLRSSIMFKKIPIHTYRYPYMKYLVNKLYCLDNKQTESKTTREREIDK